MSVCLAPMLHELASDATRIRVVSSENCVPAQQQDATEICCFQLHLWHPTYLHGFYAMNNLYGCDSFVEACLRTLQCGHYRPCQTHRDYNISAVDWNLELRCEAMNTALQLGTATCANRDNLLPSHSTDGVL
jgi:hypothetical protein